MTRLNNDHTYRWMSGFPKGRIYKNTMQPELDKERKWYLKKDKDWFNFTSEEQELSAAATACKSTNGVDLGKGTLCITKCDTKNFSSFSQLSSAPSPSLFSQLRVSGDRAASQRTLLSTRW